MRACAPLAYALVTSGWLTGGCYDSTAFDKLTHGSATEASESGGGAGSGSDTAQPPTSSTTEDPTTADDTTAATTGVDTTGGTEAPDDLPTVSLKASPLMLVESGPVALDVDHSQDVTALELFDNGVYQFGWAAKEPDPAYLITTNGEDGVHALQVRAINGDDDDAYSNVVVVTTKLPPAGSALWTKALDLDEPNQGRDLTSAIGTSGSIELLLGVDDRRDGRDRIHRLHRGDDELDGRRLHRPLRLPARRVRRHHLRRGPALPPARRQVQHQHRAPRVVHAAAELRRGPSGVRGRDCPDRRRLPR